ncbi:hypothetical protein DPMN_161799 [Dreissena polymorpha]|uniref:Uncharacterized protein n=1 Tax=Dreissena polymorpha TaxID=45954 RepID=A0A9D4ENC0_DREPO|nr:hypothetical protein DPMN_161799 [Dreissena polymorpha]
MSGTPAVLTLTFYNHAWHTPCTNTDPLLPCLALVLYRHGLPTTMPGTHIILKLTLCCLV